jgi:hypothetical protein
MPPTSRTKQAGSAALERLQASIDAAETALKDLRGEMSRDSRDLLNDVGSTVKDARRNLTRSRQRIVKDLEQIDQALMKGKAARPATKRTSTAPRTSAPGRPKLLAPRARPSRRAAPSQTDGYPGRWGAGPAPSRATKPSPTLPRPPCTTTRRFTRGSNWRLAPDADPGPRGVTAVPRQTRTWAPPPTHVSAPSVAVQLDSDANAIGGAFLSVDAVVRARVRWVAPDARLRSESGCVAAVALP